MKKFEEPQKKTLKIICNIYISALKWLIIIINLCIGLKIIK